MTRSLLVLLALACMPATAGSAWAQDNDDNKAIPPGRIGVRAAVRGSSTVGRGFTVAAVAGYHPTPLDKRVTFGAEWSAGWSYFESNADSITGSLRLFEIELGARMRLRPNLRTQHFVVLGAGAALLRADVPIGRESKRSYIGPYLSIGYEPKVGKMTLGIDARVGLIATGPTTISIGVTTTFGN